MAAYRCFFRWLEGKTLTYTLGDSLGSTMSVCHTIISELPFPPTMAGYVRTPVHP